MPPIKRESAPSPALKTEDDATSGAVGPSSARASTESTPAVKEEQPVSSSTVTLRQDVIEEPLDEARRPSSIRDSAPSPWSSEESPAAAAQTARARRAISSTAPPPPAKRTRRSTAKYAPGVATTREQGGRAEDLGEDEEEEEVLHSLPYTQRHRRPPPSRPARQLPTKLYRRILSAPVLDYNDLSSCRLASSLFYRIASDYLPPAVNLELHCDAESNSWVLWSGPGSNSDAERFVYQHQPASRAGSLSLTVTPIVFEDEDEETVDEWREHWGLTRAGGPVDDNFSQALRDHCCLSSAEAAIFDGLTKFRCLRTLELDCEVWEETVLRAASTLQHLRRLALQTASSSMDDDSDIWTELIREEEAEGQPFPSLKEVHFTSTSLLLRGAKLKSYRATKQLGRWCRARGIRTFR